MNRTETDSDSSEEYFDAEDSTPNRLSTLSRKSLTVTGKITQDFIFPEPAVKVNASSDSDATPIGTGTPVTRSPTNSLSTRYVKQDTIVESKLGQLVYGRQRFHELRQCMQNDEDENPGNTLTPDSQSKKMNRTETDSDSSEEYFDAEDSTPNRLSTLSRKSLTVTGKITQDFIFPEPAVKVNASSDSDATPIGTGTPVTRSPTNSLSTRYVKQDTIVESKLGQLVYGRQRFHELRQCMQNDEDENPGNTLTPDSQSKKMNRTETDSDSSEEYFDAEDSTPNRLSTLSRKSLTVTGKITQDFIFPEPAVKVNASSDSDATPIGTGTPVTRSPTNSLSTRYVKQDTIVESKLGQLVYGRQRFHELRQCMQNDEDENPGNTLTPDSQSKKMSRTETDSDSSEEYFDAEDSTPNRLSTLSRKSLTVTGKITQDFIFPEPAVKVNASSDSDATPIGTGTPVTRSPTNSLSTRYVKQDTIVESKLGQLVYGRQRFHELRQCMQNDEDENPGNTLTPDSQNSSTDGVFANRSTHPFKVVECDAMSVQSMTSLGRVGRILAGSIDPSAISLDREYVGGGVMSIPSAYGNSSNSHQVQQQQQQQHHHQQQQQQQVASVAGCTTSAISFDISPSKSVSPLSNSSEQHMVVNRDSSALEISVRQQQSSMSSTTFPLTVAENKITLQEPDVIASTKLAYSKTTDSITSSGPIAPPRRKKKSRKFSSSSSEQFHFNDGMRLPAADTDTDSDTKSVKSIRDVQQQRHDDLVREMERSWIEGNTLANVSSKNSNICGNLMPTLAQTMIHTHDISPDTSIRGAAFSTTATTTSQSQTLISNNRPVTTAALVGSINRMSHSLGNSSLSVYSKASPTNSSKSNSAPGRVSSIDPTKGLNVYKAIQGGYVVRPCDEACNKAEGPTQEEIKRIERLINENCQRPKLAGTGSNSLGSASRYPSLVQRTGNDKERRKSAGDEDVLKQMNIYVRTRTNSGKQLSDFEILEQVPVKNLDTGENMPLSEVRPPPVPEGWNPLSLHILKLTSHLEVIQKESDDESVIGIPPSNEGQPQEEEEGEAEDGSSLKKKTAKIKRFFGSTVRKTVDKAKSLASEVSHARHKEDVADIVDVMNPEQNIKIKASSTNKGPYEFTKLQHVQDLSGEHTGAVWCMKFSSCGRLLATAGQDKMLRIWVLKDAYAFFQDVRNRYNDEQKSSPTPSQESLVSQHSAEEAIALATAAEQCTGPFMPKSFCTYNGHTSDLLDVSWSKNYFILSSSMDKTVRLWHISRKECLCCFQHIDFVTAIAFHPRDDRYFLSGSLDGKLRLWNIPDKKVAVWNEVDGQTKLITAANFCQNGEFAVVGSYDGRCIFYNTDQLKYHTQIHVRSTRGKNRIGRKISGIEPMPGEDKILVTSNDSRVRLYDLRDLNLSCKYKGYLNVSSQIKASFSHDGKYIIAGSENQCIYIWKTNHEYFKLSSVRRDRSDFWEGIKAHNATVTCAIFAPHPEAIIKPEPDEISSEKPTNNQPDPLVEQHKKGCGYVMVSADFNGAIKVFINKTKPKHSSLPYTAIAD